MLQKLFSSLLESAASTAGEKGAGWVLHLILGGDGNQSPTPGEAEILKELAEEKQQLDDLQSSVNALALQLTNAQFAIKSQLEQSTYDELVGSASSNIGSIQTAVQQVCELGAEDRPYVADGTDIARIKAIRENALGMLTALDKALMGVNSEGILRVYSKATWNTLAPAATQQPNQAIYTPAYLASMQSLLSYYTTLAGQLFNAYVEAVHWESDAHGTVPALEQDNPDKIGKFHSQLVVYLNSWSKEATRDITSIADGTVVDTRTSPMNVWTSTATILDGVESDRYCASVTPLCVGPIWATDSTTQLVSRVIPSFAPITAYVSAQHPGKHAPTTAEWTALLSNTAEGTSLSDGVSNWAFANNFPLLQAKSYAVPGGTQSTVPPVLVTDGQVLTFNSVPYTAPVAKTGNTGTGYAGYLALISPQVTTPPFTDDTVLDSAERDARAAANQAGLPPADEPLTVSDEAATHAAEPGAPTSMVGTLGAPSTFTLPGCALGAYLQPVGANAVKVTVRGASGGRSRTNRELAGGGGATVTATIPLGAGGVLYPQVGGVGQPQSSFRVPGAGGVGGGGTGGGGPNGNNSQTSGAGGGGMSGISTDPTCHQWLVIAGGGGGAGGLADNDPAGEGGNGCLSTGCAGHPVTFQGGGTGGDLITGGTGGSIGSAKAGNGANGTLYQAGAGGTGQHAQGLNGNGGGGGGGGYGSGGGGGGGVAFANGAGGGGGGSYVADGVSTASFTPGSTLNSGTAVASVTIEPIVAPEYVIGYLPTATYPSDAVLDTTTGALAYGVTVTRSNATGGANQSWALLRPSYDSSTFLLNNPATAWCASPGPTSAQDGARVYLERCLDTSGSPGPSWTLVPATRQTGFAGGYRLQTQAGRQAFSYVNGSNPGDSEVRVVDPTKPEWASDDNLQWGLHLSTPSIWATSTAKNALTSTLTSEPREPAPSGDPHAAPGKSTPTGTHLTRLPATGTNPWNALAAALLLTTLGVLVRTATRRPPRRG